MILNKQKHGFILPAALLLLVISCSALSLAAYNSGRIAILASRRETELKRNWSAKALEKLLLPAADEILDGQADSTGDLLDTQNHSFAQRYGQIELNSITFQWLLRDEQAMANINSLIATRDLRGLLEAMRKLMEFDISSDEKMAELILPLKQTEIKTFDEFLDYGSQPDRLFSIDKESSGGAIRLSCWGDGKLNILRADRKTLETVLAGHMDLNTIVTLISLRQNLSQLENEDNTEDSQDQTSRNISLSELLKILELDDNQRKDLSELVCTKSNTFSLTLQLKSETNNWRRMYILDNQNTDEVATTENNTSGESKSDRAGLNQRVYQW